MSMSINSFYFANNSSNLLDGSLPDIFAEMKSMQTFFFDHNFFTGPIPPSFWKMERIVDLEFDNNFFSG